MAHDLYEKPVMDPILLPTRYPSFDAGRMQDDVQRVQVQMTATASSRKSSWCDWKLLNIILLSLGFCFCFGAFQACMLAQTVILNSIRDDYFTGTPTIGYVGLAMNFAGMGISFVLSPALAVLIGPKKAMIAGATCTIVALSTLVRPLEVTLYLGSMLQGAGIGTIWTVYGHFLTDNSTTKNIGRNTAIFWVVFNLGPLCLNLFYFLITRGMVTITEETRYLFFMVVLPVAALSIVAFAGLDGMPCCQQKQMTSKQEEAAKTDTGNRFQEAKAALRAELDMILSKDMLMLAPMFIYMGIELTFFINVYGTSLGYSWQFGEMRESLVGLHGVFLATGQLSGGLIYGLLARCLKRFGKDCGILLALMVHLAAFYIAFLVVPERAAFEMTFGYSSVPNSPYLAMLCSFLLGFGDAGWNNPLFALLGALAPENPIAAFAIFQAWQAVGNVVAFAYSGALTIPYQLVIAAVLGIVGAFGFFLVEWKQASKEAKALAEMKKVPIIVERANSQVTTAM